MVNKETTLAYLAGALDGDGSFSLIKGTSSTSISPLYYPMVQLANAKPDIIEMLVSEFGGNQGIRLPYMGKDGSERLISYRWKLEKSTKCLPMLEDIIPYLIIKRQRAEFLRDYIIDNPFVRGSNKLNADVLVKREKAYLKMRSFNDYPQTNCELFSISKRKDSDDSKFWAYIAGIMDTDGSFSLKKEHRRSGRFVSNVYTSTILLTQTDCRSIYNIMNNFEGGNLMIVKAKTATNGFCYRFSITSRKNAIKFLKKCIPYLVIKKEVASKLLDYCENVKMLTKNNSEFQMKYRQTFYTEIKQLNKYGVYKFPLIDLKTLPDNAEGNKAEAAKAGTVNVVSEETTFMKVDAVL